MRLVVALAAVLFAPPAMACEVRLRHPVPVCPAVTTSPSDCQGGASGRAGQRITSPATVHLLKGGYAYYCPSHESCVPLEAVVITKCVLSYVPRQAEESPEYLGHITVE